MLDAALAELRAGGLAVGLERVNFEDAIRAADVSRTAAYRHWPHKDAFLADLVVELAGVAIPVAATRSRRSTALIRSVVGDHGNRLHGTEERGRVLEAVVRAAATDDFAIGRTEQEQWGSYLILMMSVQSMPAGELREKVSAAVAGADDRLIDRIAGNYRRLVEFFDYRATVDYRELAAIGLAMLRGLVIGGMARDGAEAGDTPGIAFAALVAAAVEPDGQHPWDEARVAAKLAELDVDDLFADPAPPADPGGAASE